MAFQVQEESLDTARDEAIATLNATRTVSVDGQRYDWLYRNNPDGEAVLWSIRKAETGRMAGFTVALPRRMLVDGKPRVCWNGADFSMHREFRSLGLAIKLRRAARQGIDDGRADFLYAHPNARMQRIHERVGHCPVGTMVRYAKPLRSEPYLRKRLGGRYLPAVAGRLIDAGMRIGGCRWRHRFVSSVRVDPAPVFDSRFDYLFEEAARMRRIVGFRDSRYLAWRYGKNPLYRTQSLLSEDSGRLVGYALFREEDAVAHVKDLLFAGDAAVARDLVVRLTQYARRRGLASISAVVLEGHPVVDVLEQFGFVRRDDASRMFGYASARSGLAELLLDPHSWLLSVGDRDV